jgi:hypothetical protein
MNRSFLHTHSITEEPHGNAAAAFALGCTVESFENSKRLVICRAPPAPLTYLTYEWRAYDCFL